MPKIYTHLAQERAVVMTMQDDQYSVRAIVNRLGSAPRQSGRRPPRPDQGHAEHHIRPPAVEDRLIPGD